MTQREKEVLELLRENPMISQKECAVRLGISRSAVAVHIMNLTDKGMIRGKGYIFPGEPYAVVIGGSNMDILGSPDGPFRERDSNPGKVTLSPGGVGRNIAENLSRLGIPVKLLTVLGDDSYGTELRKVCGDSGIDMSHIKFMSGRSTPVYLAIQDDNGDMISAISDMSLMERLDRPYLEKERRVLDSASLIIADANLSEDSLSYIAEKYGDKDIIIDTVSSAKAAKTESLLGRFHTAKPNRIEAEILTGLKIRNIRDGAEAAQKLVERGLKQVFLSLGDQGICYSDEERSLFFRKEPVKALNTTGAGDAFTAALAYCHMKGYSPEKTMAFASEAAKMTVLCRYTINRDISAEKIEETIKGENFYEQISRYK